MGELSLAHVPKPAEIVGFLLVMVHMINIRDSRYLEKYQPNMNMHHIDI
jgi:hypothetical protein